MAALAYQEIPEDRIDHVKELITQYFQRFIDQMRTEFGTIQYGIDDVLVTEGDDEVVKKNKLKKRIIVTYFRTVGGIVDASSILNIINPSNYSSGSFEIMEAIMEEVTANPDILDPVSVASILMATNIRSFYDLQLPTHEHDLRHIYPYEDEIQDDAERDEVIAIMHDIMSGPPAKKKGGRKSKKNRKNKKRKNKRTRRNL